jgi:hypothetical protein
MGFENAAQKKQQPDNLPASERPTRPELRIIEGGKGKDEFENLVDPKLVGFYDATTRRVEQLKDSSTWNRETGKELLGLFEEVAFKLEGNMDPTQVTALKIDISDLRKQVEVLNKIKDIPVSPLSRPRAVGNLAATPKPNGVFGKAANWFK